MERIICAAIHYINGQVEKDQPKGIDSGFVIAGRRHNDCLQIAAKIPEVDLMFFNKHRTTAMGFLTNTNRFVSRKEAYQIAKAANQIIGPKPSDDPEAILTSEELY